jgi:hypothetical protein
MVLGLVLILIGALAVVAALFTAHGSAELLGVDTSAMALYFIGLGSGVAILWGLSLTRWGTKRNLRQRRESKRLDDLSEKLDKRDADEREDNQESGDRSF